MNKYSAYINEAVAPPVIKLEFVEHEGISEGVSIDVASGRVWSWASTGAAPPSIANFVSNPKYSGTAETVKAFKEAVLAGAKKGPEGALKAAIVVSGLPARYWRIKK